MTQVGIYLRISDGDDLPIKRQETDARALCKRLGWSVATVYADVSISAFKDVVRPDWERMLADLKSGAIDGVVSYDWDRIARKPKDLERLIDRYDARPLVFATVTQSDVDLSTPDGRFIARLMVNFASKSSADMSRRLTRKQRELAEAGKPSGGGTRAFGWTRGGMELEPTEAAVIQEAAKRILAGESPNSVCRELDERGVPTPGRSPKWEPGVLKRLLIRPRIAGIRQHQGAIMLSDSGEPVRAVWEPALDVETWEAVRALLTDPEREIGRGKDDRKYLLSGVLRCQCGAKMYGVHKKGKHHYQCPIYRGCGNTCRVGAPIDEHVTELVLRYLEHQELAPVATDIDVSHKVDEDIEAAEHSLAALIAQWGAGNISDSVFFSAQAKKEAVVNRLRRERANTRRKATLSAPVGPGVRQAWAQANHSQKRAILHEVLTAVLVKPKPPGRTPFRPEYYLPVWRVAD